ncbi:hypothetical protein BDY21DRAFT_424114 [Lineolata rhizophorae]|uniref:Uncharacterized protein n=1 Tax=Lineolata rhizophorae TaxID=578093 RepID=A0A6A6NRA8_9PEZI|nr:hypothetical protein BDY21DRAFT_424114 [Lineolata rhizophorae]
MTNRATGGAKWPSTDVAPGPAARQAHGQAQRAVGPGGPSAPQAAATQQAGPPAFPMLPGRIVAAAGPMTKPDSAHATISPRRATPLVQPVPRQARPRARPIAVPAPPSPPLVLVPWAVLRRLGLALLQSRRLHRPARRIVRRPTPDARSPANTLPRHHPSSSQ